MARIMSIDYGGRRTGIAVTDPLQIIATALTTVDTSALMEFLEKYLSEEEVEEMVVGDPMNLDGSPSQNSERVMQFVAKVKKRYPDLKVTLHDERFTSKIALKSMVASGQSKKKRRDKRNIDKIAATILLQDYLQHSNL